MGYSWGVTIDGVEHTLYDSSWSWIDILFNSSSSWCVQMDWVPLEHKNRFTADETVEHNWFMGYPIAFKEAGDTLKLRIRDDNLIDIELRGRDFITVLSQELARRFERLHEASSILFQGTQQALFDLDIEFSKELIMSYLAAHAIFPNDQFFLVDGRGDCALIPRVHPKKLAETAAKCDRYQDYLDVYVPHIEHKKNAIGHPITHCPLVGLKNDIFLCAFTTSFIKKAPQNLSIVQVPPALMRQKRAKHITDQSWDWETIMPQMTAALLWAESDMCYVCGSTKNVSMCPKCCLAARCDQCVCRDCVILSLAKTCLSTVDTSEEEVIESIRNLWR